MYTWLAFALVLFIAAIVFRRHSYRSKQLNKRAHQFALEKALKDFTSEAGILRARGAEFLAGTGDPDVIPPLLRGRRDPVRSNPEDDCVDRALRTLCASLGLQADQVRRDYDLKVIGITPTDDLLPWWGASDAILREAAMRKIALALRVDPSGELAQRVLGMAFSGSADYNLRQRAAENLAMAQLEDRLVRRAVAILESESSGRFDREDAVDVLTRFNAGVEAIPCLIKQVQEQRWGMSPRAIKALTRLLKAKGEKVSTESLESVKNLLARPVLVAVAAPDDPDSTITETVNTEEIETLVVNLLVDRYRRPNAK